MAAGFTAHMCASSATAAHRPPGRRRVTLCLRQPWPLYLAMQLSQASRRRLRHCHSALTASRSSGGQTSVPAAVPAAAAAAAAAATAADELCLTDAQRDACLASLDRDSFCVLPVRLPRHMVERANAYMDGYMHDPARANAPSSEGTAARPLTGGGGVLTEMGIVEADPVFREYLSFKPALQLCYDVFGPMFHLAHDKWSRKLRPEDTPPHLTPESSFPFGWHSDGPVGFPEVDGRVPMSILRFGYLTTSCQHAGSGTIEFMRGSHRSMRCAGAQRSLRFEPLGTTPHLQSPEMLTDGDQGADPALYSADHVEIRAEAGTVVAFQNGVWHRALALGSASVGKPRSVVYFGYCPCMLRPLHRPTPYGGDADALGLTAEERWLLHEDKPPTGWIYGSVRDHMRMDRFRRSGAGADHYERKLAEAVAAQAVD
jgi:hypothetical protein